MALEPPQALHILFFPLMAPGHMLPMIEIAKLFVCHGINATILTTPANALPIQHSIRRYPNIQLHLIPFPTDSGLPAGCENLTTVPCEDLEPNLFAAVGKLGPLFDRVLVELHPDYVVTDGFLPWTYDVTSGHNIPRIVFHGSSLFARCAFDSIDRCKVFDNLASGAESFVIPGFPDRIEMSVASMPDGRKLHPVFLSIFAGMKESDPKSFGEVVNTFHELEPGYADHYMSVVKRKFWCVGPVSLRNSDTETDAATCLNWLDRKSPGSVVYVSFGSICRFSNSQLRELALGLEAANRPFVWTVRASECEWMPDGYEERIKDKGLIIRGWAPQIRILNHEAVGGFVTHCGWNSSLEAICAGLPLVTWPLFAEQFFNERLIVDVLKIGVSVGMAEYSMKQLERRVVEASRVESAVNLVMGEGEEAEQRRRRARELAVKARTAVEVGGSSYNDTYSLINILKYHKAFA